MGMHSAYRGEKWAKENRDVYASAGPNDWRYGRIYPGMLRSPQFRELTSGEKVFFMTCRAHAASNESRRCLYEYYKEEGKNPPNGDDQYRYFVFPAKQLREYGIERGYASKCFEHLIQAGFIEKVEANKHRHKINIYRFSDKWQVRPP